MEGKGALTITGHLGDVMQESARAAVSFLRSHYEDFEIPKDFHKKMDIHIHAPEGAIPKDGPSAGITIATAVVSAVTEMAVKPDIAMTGEITVFGQGITRRGHQRESPCCLSSGYSRDNPLSQEQEGYRRDSTKDSQAVDLPSRSSF